MGLIEKAEGLVGLAALAAIGYIVVKNWQNLKDMWCSIPGVCNGNGEEQQCPSGFHKEEQYPGMCIKDADLVNYDEHGCRTDIQQYCDIQHRCLDNAIYDNACVPEKTLEPCPAGQHRNINLPGYPCHPIEGGEGTGGGTAYDCTGTPPWPGAHCCADGSWRGFASPCPEDQVIIESKGCGQEIPAGSGCYPYAIGLRPLDENGEDCGKYCNTRCSDIYGNYKPCDDEDTGGFVDPFRCPSSDFWGPGGYFPDSFGNLMKGVSEGHCIEVCHRDDRACAHALPDDAGGWRNIYD